MSVNFDKSIFINISLIVLQLIFDAIPNAINAPIDDPTTLFIFFK